MFAPKIAGAALAALAAAAMLAPVPATASDLVVQASAHSVPVTIDRVVAALNKRGIEVAARMDHAAAATAAGMELRPTQVIMFGNPKLGTPLMQVDQRVALELPMKIIAWQGADGKVWIGYRAPKALETAHGLAAKAPVIETMGKALAAISKEAAGK